MKVGLFGGSFDPIHQGHVEPVLAAQRALGPRPGRSICRRRRRRTSPSASFAPALRPLRHGRARAARPCRTLWSRPRADPGPAGLHDRDAGALPRRATRTTELFLLVGADSFLELSQLAPLARDRSTPPGWWCSPGPGWDSTIRSRGLAPELAGGRRRRAASTSSRTRRSRSRRPKSAAAARRAARRPRRLAVAAGARYLLEVSPLPMTRPSRAALTVLRDIRARVREAVAAALTTRKAEDVRVRHLEPVTDFTDYFVIASGTNERQVQAIADAVEERLRDDGRPPAPRRGLQRARSGCCSTTATSSSTSSSRSAAATTASSGSGATRPT